MTVLRAKDLTLPELLALLGQCDQGRVWVDAPDGWSLAHWSGLTGQLPWCGAGREPGEVTAEDAVSRSLSGRLFEGSGELKWRKLPVLGESAWRTVYLGDDAEFVTTLQKRDELAGLKTTRSENPLWGILTSRTKGDWVELRIPNRFRYPVEIPTPPPKTLAVKAIVETWKDVRGEVHFVRLCDLSAYPVGE